MFCNFSKDKLLKYFNIFLIAFLVIQPIFDLKIFYNSISTLIRVVFIIFLFVFYFLLDRNKKKYLLLIYPIILTIYIILHHINAVNFSSLVPGNFNYSFFSELLYFLKMVTPFLLIYVLYTSKLDRSIIFKIIKSIVLIMALIIIISNLFVFSYSSYNDQIIKANFLSMFNNSNNYTYQELSSKGLFEFANQISAVLLMFLPFCLLSFIETRNVPNLLIIIINIFSLFLLGTKVAVFGIFIVFAYTLIIYIFNNKLLKKEKISYYMLSILLIMIVAYSIILPNNPAFMRISETESIEASSDVIELTKDDYEIIYENEASVPQDSTETKIGLVDFVEQNYKEKEIKEEFITKSYPYNYDPEFWNTIFNEPRINRVDYRFIEQAMIKRVVKINNNKLDLFLGITNTRLQNIFNIERDFVVQYYALGIIGCTVVLGPYFILLGIYLFKLLKSKFVYFSIVNAISFTTIIMLFGISYHSGNLLNSLSFTMYFSLLYKLLWP